MFIYKATKMASVDNKNNYCHEVINDKEKTYIVTRKQVQDTNSGYVFGDQLTNLEYQQCGSSFKFTAILKSTGFYKFLI